MSQYLGDISAYALAVSQGYTGTEEEYAELMASYATVGQTAVDAKDAAVAAKTAAQTAATTATNKASEATTAAQTATTKAGEASTSASTATSAKDTAVSASQTATSKATEATAAAATATSAASTATTAKDDAVSAKTAAQTAQTGAETAAASVQSSAAQIATNAVDISQLKSELTDNIADQKIEFAGMGYVKLNASPVDLTNIVSSDTYRHAIIPCSKGDVFTINAVGSGDALPWAFVNDANINLFCGQAGTFSNAVIIAPENASYLVINDKSGSESYYGHTTGTALFPDSYTNIETDIFVTDAVERDPMIPILTLSQMCFFRDYGYQPPQLYANQTYYDTFVYSLKKGKKYRISAFDIDLWQSIWILSTKLTSQAVGDTIQPLGALRSTRTKRYIDSDIIAPCDCYLYVLVQHNAPSDKVYRYQSIVNKIDDKLRDPRKIYVAASNASNAEKAYADYIADGIDDAILLRKIVSDISDTGGTIILSGGEFVLSSTTMGEDGVNRFVHIPNNAYMSTIAIEGQGVTTNRNDLLTNDATTAIRISNACYENLSSETTYIVIGAVNRNLASSYGSWLKLDLYNFGIYLPDNKKKIIGIDMRWVGRPKMKYVGVYGHIEEYNALTEGVQGCVGIRMTNGNNVGIVCDFENCICAYLYEGWQVGGEHVVMTNCAAIGNTYGYTFGNYPYTQNASKPITMINCCDERNKNLPLFVQSGAYNGNGYTVSSPQLVEMYGFNIEWWATDQFPTLGNRMVVEDDNCFCGIITLKTEASDPLRLFETDGNGENFKILMNAGLKSKGASTYRQAYTATFHEGDRFFDTTLNKMLWKIGTTWCDANGNAVP